MFLFRLMQPLFILWIQTANSLYHRLTQTVLLLTNRTCLFVLLACLEDSLQMCVCMEVSYKLPFVRFGQQVCFCCELIHGCLYCRLMAPVYIMYTHTACLFVLQTVTTCLWLLWAHTSCPFVLETHSTFQYFNVIQYHICILDTYNTNGLTQCLCIPD